jgi:hypothetical protein
MSLSQKITVALMFFAAAAGGWFARSPHTSSSPEGRMVRWNARTAGLVSGFWSRFRAKDAYCAWQMQIPRLWARNDKVLGLEGA